MPEVEPARAGVLPEVQDETEPYAEQFMAWFGSFFIEETAQADLRSTFCYSKEVRSARFPLLRINLSDDLEAEINGISMSFASMPEGITEGEIKQRKHLTVQLAGNTRTKFAKFEIRNEVARLSAFALRLTEPTKTK